MSNPPQTSIDLDRAPVVLKIMGGPPGPEGPPNAGVAIVGIANSWPPVSKADKGDLYIVPDPPPANAPAWALPGHGAFWSGTDWLDAGLLRGTRGERGEPGPPLVVKGTLDTWPPSSTPGPGEIWQLADKPIIGLPQEFKQGGAAAWDAARNVWVPLEAIRGPAGHSIEVFGPSDIPPATALVEVGDIWLATDPTLFANTFDPSSIVQMPGPPGAKGDTGPSAFDAWRQAVGRPTAPLDEFITAIKGATGAKGDQGAAGETFKIEGVVPDAAHLPPTPPRLTVYLISTTGELWIYDTNSAAAGPDGYVNLGKIAGPAGRSAWMSPPIYDAAQLPNPGQAGELVYMTSTGHIWGWDDTASVWVDGGRIGATGLDDGANQGDTLAWDDTNKKWAARPSPLPAGTTEGDTIVWDATASAWVDRYFALANLEDVHVDPLAIPKTGSVLVWKGYNWAPGDPVTSLATLTDVSLPADLAPHDGHGLAYDARIGKWVPADMATQVELNAHKLYATYSQMRNTPIRATINTPSPVPPRVGLTFLVGDNPTGEFAGHANEIVSHAEGDGYQFEAPLVDHVRWHDERREFIKWSGAAWVHVPLEEYERTANHAGFVRDIDGRAFGIGGANGSSGHTGATLEFLYDANTPSTACTKIIVHDCSEMDFGRAATIRGIMEPVTDDEVANKKYVDEKIAALVTGLAHGVAVESIGNTPPTTLLDGNAYIVGTTPSGAWAGKQNQVATVHAGGWLFAVPSNGDTHLVEADKAQYSWNGSAWVKVADAAPAAPVGDAMPVGAIIMWPNGRLPTNYLELNGSKFDAVEFPDLYRLLGSDTLPDFRGQYVRGARAGNAALTTQGWSTGRPRTAVFTTDNTGAHTHTTDTQGQHTHQHTYQWPSQHAPHGGNARVCWEGSLNHTETTTAAGNHSHNVNSGGAHTHTITGGGDAETRPDTIYAVYLIKAKI